MTRKQRSAAARKGWRTRRANKRSAAARKGWRTRKRRAAAKPAKQLLLLRSLEEFEKAYEQAEEFEEEEIGGATDSPTED